MKELESILQMILSGETDSAIRIRDFCATLIPGRDCYELGTLSKNYDEHSVAERYSDGADGTADRIEHETAELAGTSKRA